MAKVIGLSGKAGSGKDFVAKNVLRQLGYTQIGFSWPLKLEAVREGDGTFEEVFVTKPASVRAALIARGMERRRVDPEHWIKQAASFQQLMERERGETKFVYTDVRFANEYRFIKAQMGKMVRLEHGDRPYALAGTAAAEHASETELDRGFLWDSRIVNHVGTSAQLLRTVLEHDGVLPEPLLDWDEQHGYRVGC